MTINANSTLLIDFKQITIKIKPGKMHYFTNCKKFDHKSTVKPLISACH